MTVLTVIVLLACSSPESDWKKADAQGTVAAYQAFLKDHPNNAHADQARDRIHALEDEQAWAGAQKTNTPESFQAYLQNEPKGGHFAEAHDRTTTLERSAAWKVVQTNATAPALQEFLERYPQGPEADQARAQLQTLKAGEYRVQLGAFRSKHEAETVRARLQARYGTELREVTVVPATPQDRRNRVDSAPMTLENAQSTCVKLNKEHRHCEVVKS
jgi:cell division protein FtsN